MFGNKLKQLRINKGLTQEELGKKFNLGKSSISMYESGKNFPDLDMVKDFAEYFEVSTDYLIGVESLNKSDMYEIEQLRQILINNGILSEDHDMTKEEFDKAMEFYKANAKFFIDK
jgi:transcriptional regulator with XRE-family HTH domain